MTKLILVGQEAGGVGKTTTSLMLAEFYRARGINLTVLDADDKNLGRDGESLLAHALPHHQVVWLGTGPSIDEIERDADSPNSHWDKVRALLVHENVLLDLAASSIQRFLEYGAKMRASRLWKEAGIEIEVWVPVVPDLSAIEAAVKTLATAGQALGGRLVMLRNHRDGGFDNLKGTQHGKAMAGLEKAGVVMIDLPKAPIPADGLRAMRQGPWTSVQVQDMTAQEVMDNLQLGRGVAERTLFGAEDWIRAIEAAWAAVLPPVMEGND